MALTRHLLVLIAVAQFGKAFVDTYVYHYDVAKASKDYLANYAASYYDQRDQLLTTYNGDLGETCKSKLAKERWYGITRIELQTVMIQLVGEIKTVDTDWYNEAQQCGDDQACGESTNTKWTTKLEDFQSSAESKINQIQQDNLSHIKSYMDSCTQSFNCKR